MTKRVPLYPYSYEYAQRCSDAELEAYMESHRENIRCANAIEDAISSNYADNSLNTEGIRPVIKKYGFDRVNWILAYNIQQLSYDGRISRENVEWAKQIYIPEDMIQGLDRRRDYRLSSHQGLLDLSARFVRRQFDALNLFEGKHCHSPADMDFKGRLMVLKPTCLADEYKHPDFQIFLCQSGFGCSPAARGRKVFGAFLKDGEYCSYDRGDFLGELREEYIPQWAQEKLEEMKAAQEQKTAQEQKQRGEMRMDF